MYKIGRESTQPIISKNVRKKLRLVTACRSCRSNDLINILSLGEQGLSDFVETSNDENVVKYPLELVLCQNCNLLQMRHSVPPYKLYTERYGYRSGINQTMHTELSNITEQAEKIASLKPDDIVVDIGCNDGTLLSCYKTSGLIRVGFDPVTTFAKYFRKTLANAKVSKYKLFSDFFSGAPFLKQFGKKRAKIVTAISMFYDLDDPNKFLEDVKEILHPDGFFIIQQNYLVGMLAQYAFDNIVHEHLEYYSMESLENLLRRHDLEVFDVKQTDVNGGSFRTFIKFKSSKINSRSGFKRVSEIRNLEKRFSLGSKQIYLDFADRVNEIRSSLKRFVKSEVKKGKKIYIYGASTRGNTLIQACSLDYRFIKAASERNKDKWGKKIASTGIPIISEEQARKDHPDYFLVLPWFFRQEFLEREKEYLISGGKMIFPLPRLEIVSLNNGKIEIAPFYTKRGKKY